MSNPRNTPVSRRDGYGGGSEKSVASSLVPVVVGLGATIFESVSQLVFLVHGDF